jgi:hypothetical protein
VTSFLHNLCTRTQEAVYCDTELKFTQYQIEAPVISLATATLRGGKLGKVKVRLSKISRVVLEFSRNGRVVYKKPGVIVGHGKPALSWQVPRKAGDYDVELTATDLAGNVGTAEGTIHVLKPKKRGR